MERKNRKVLVGKVVSDKADKTIKVAISSYRRHPLYGKRMERTSKVTAHDENNVAGLGDIVKIAGTRPLSKTKHFRLVEVVQKANNV